eukprot:85501-Pelagomonas_calceolata.AAC.5
MFDALYLLDCSTVSDARDGQKCFQGQEPFHPPLTILLQGPHGKRIPEDPSHTQTVKASRGSPLHRLSQASIDLHACCSRPPISMP